jgi:hypothetical protein
MNRIKEASTWAGIGLLAQGIAQAITSKGLDPTAWATIVGGLFAVVVKEKAAQ